MFVLDIVAVIIITITTDTKKDVFLRAAALVTAGLPFAVLWIIDGWDEDKEKNPVIGMRELLGCGTVNTLVGRIMMMVVMMLCVLQSR